MRRDSTGEAIWDGAGFRLTPRVLGLVWSRPEAWFLYLAEIAALPVAFSLWHVHVPNTQFQHPV